MSELRLRDFPEPFGTADLSDEIVNQRVSVTVAVGNHGDRTGRSGVSIYLDAGLTGDQIGEWGPESWRGESTRGFRLTEDERRYVAACLYGAAINLIAHDNEANQ